ncbi:MAG: radical SAM protein [Bacteroidales bacterium]|nr:radical SAM protein [Bacteroidales bacterium]
MNIGLIDVDTHNYPNLPLMKLSAWHKAQGDNVDWYTSFTHYDIVYMSKVFSFTPDFSEYVNADRVVRGGTGYALHGAGGEDYQHSQDKPLPEEIEHIYPDYSLYHISNTAYGFLTRGCPRGCDFCIVGKKEGRCSRKVADLNEFWDGQKNIVLNDPNILACREWKDLLQQLIDSRAWVNFNQGLDIRLMTEEKAAMLSQIKIKEIHFAWDRYEDKDIVLPKLRLYAGRTTKRPHSHNSIVYVLVNHGSTIEQDLERIYTLRDMGYWAYVMVYDKANASQTIKDLQRWCNNRFIFSSCPRFEDYNKPQDHVQSNQLSLFGQSL